MRTYREVKGDLVQLADNGEFDVITHGCNCWCNMGAGIAVPMKRKFGCDTFKLEGDKYRGVVNKLGQIDFETLYKEDGNWVKYPDEGGKWVTNKLTVVNSYTQFAYGRKHKPLDYEALTLCMRKIGILFPGKHIGLPQIGSGLAGGDWNRIKRIIQNELSNLDVTIVIYNK